LTKAKNMSIKSKIIRNKYEKPLCQKVADLVSETFDTIEEFSKATDINRATCHNILADKRPPSKKTIEKLIDFFNLPPDYFDVKSEENLEYQKNATFMSKVIESEVEYMTKTKMAYYEKEIASLKELITTYEAIIESLNIKLKGYEVSIKALNENSPKT